LQIHFTLLEQFEIRPDPIATIVPASEAKKSLCPTVPGPAVAGGMLRNAQRGPASLLRPEQIAACRARAPL
jgi:hypothetical protein